MLRFFAIITLVAAIIIGALAYVQGDLTFRASATNGLVGYTGLSGSTGIVGSMKSMASGLFQRSP